MAHVCPWWFAYTFDNRLRRFFHRPESVLADHVEEGMTVMDIGCGMGFFSIAIAKMVGKQGRVVSVDMQQKMLNRLMKRAARANVSDRIVPILCKSDDISFQDKVDFALCFWMVHEVPNKMRFFNQVRECLKPSAKFLITEPKFHVSSRSFIKMLDAARSARLVILERPVIRFSRTILLGLSY